MNSLSISILIILAESRLGGLRLDAIRTLTGMEVVDISAAAEPLVAAGLAEWRLRRGQKRTIDITDDGKAAARRITKSATLSLLPF